MKMLHPLLVILRIIADHLGPVNHTPYSTHTQTHITNKHYTIHIVPYIRELNYYLILCTGLIAMIQIITHQIYQKHFLFLHSLQQSTLLEEVSSVEQQKYDLTFCRHYRKARIIIRIIIKKGTLLLELPGR